MDRWKPPTIGPKGWSDAAPILCVWALLRRLIGWFVLCLWDMFLGTRRSRFDLNSEHRLLLSLRRPALLSASKGIRASVSATRK